MPLPLAAMGMSMLSGSGGAGGLMGGSSKPKTHIETTSSATGEITLGGPFNVGSGSAGDGAAAAGMPEWVWAAGIGVALLAVLLLFKGKS